MSEINDETERPSGVFQESATSHREQFAPRLERASSPSRQVPALQKQYEEAQ